MLGKFNLIEAWNMFASFCNRLVAWMFCVLGGGDWDPDYVENHEF